MAAVTSQALVHARALALLDGHPADGGLRSQLGLRRKLLHQDFQHGVYFPVHPMDLD